MLRCLQLGAHGYEVTVTELVGWGASMKNRLIIAAASPSARAGAMLNCLAALLGMLGLEELSERFFTS